MNAAYAGFRDIEIAEKAAQRINEFWRAHGVAARARLGANAAIVSDLRPEHYCTGSAAHFGDRLSRRAANGTLHSNQSKGGI